MLGWGLAFRSGVGIVLAVLSLGVLLARIRDEERLLGESFGAEYDAYLSRTWCLIPYVYSTSLGSCLGLAYPVNPPYFSWDTSKMAIISGLIAVAFLIYLILRIVGMIGGYRTNVAFQTTPEKPPPVGPNRFNTSPLPKRTQKNWSRFKTHADGMGDVRRRHATAPIACSWTVLRRASESDAKIHRPDRAG
jgi:hypothetical protein